MNKIILVALLILTSVGVPNAQPGYFSIKKIRKNRSLSFPILNGIGNLRSQTKINQFLQLSELRSLADKGFKHIFDAAVINDGSIYGRKVSLSYHVHANSARIFSVSIDNSMDGATTHWWTSYYNFNSQNGDRISLRDLFTKDGYAKFLTLVIAKRSTAYRAEVARKVPPEERHAFLGVLGSIESDDLSDFSLGADRITIDGQNLLGKSFCCESLNLEVNFELRDYKRWLNRYGRLVFKLQNGDLAQFRSNELPQLFTGTVGATSPFVGVIFYNGLSGTEGIYAYLKYKTGIYLTGTLEKQEIELTEHVLRETTLNMRTDSNHRYEDGGTISGTFDGNRLNGTWTDKARTRTLPIIAKRE